MRRNDCVILPGIGAFISVHIPAHYEEETATWHPMSREIRFNQAVNQDDGLLANSYARKYSLPFHEARVLLDSDIRSMMSLIEQDGEVSVGRIGTLSAGEANSLVFSPFFSQTFSGKEIGLIPVSAYPVKSQIKKEEKIEDTDVPQVKEAEEIGRKFDTVKNYYIAVNKVFAKVACSVIAICLVAALVILNTDNRLGEDKASVIPVKEIVDTTTSLTKGHSEASSLEDKAEICQDEAEAGEADENNIVEPAKKRYHLIVGTFSTEAEAKKYLSTIGAMSEEMQLIPSKTLWRVSVASSDDKSELITRLNSRQVSECFDGAWIYEDKSAL